MQKILLYRFLVTVISCFAIMLLSACEKKMADPEGSLKEQAERYWTERFINKNFKYTYDQEAKAKVPPFEVYEQKLKVVTRIPTKSVRVKEVKVEGKDGIVKLIAKCQIQGAPALLDVPMGDRWVIEKGRWKHIPQIKFE